MFISGPRTSTLGSETGTTSCMLMAGQGGDHITSSMIYHSSTVTCIPSALSTSGTATFNGCVNVNTGNQIRLYNSAKNNWVQIDSPLTAGDAAIDFKLTTQSGILYINNTGVACFNNAICAPRAELTSDASCVPLRLINGVITGGDTTGVTALYFGDAGSGVSMMQREKYAANQANLVLYSEYGYNTQSINACFGYNGVAFYTAGVKRQSIDASGITCFSSTVCSPQFRANVGGCGCIAFFSANGNIVFDNGSISAIGNMGNNASQFSVSSRGCLTFRVGESGDPSAAPLRFLMDTNGIACFACQICVGGDIKLDTGAADAQIILKNNASGNPRSIAYNVGDASISFNRTSGGAGATFFNSGVACFANTICLPTSNTSLVAGTYGTISNVGGIDVNIGNNAYYDGTNWRRFAAQEAARIYINRNSFSFLRKASDGAGSCISWDDTLFLASSGIACFACAVCTPVLRASRLISNYTQVFDGDFSLNVGVTRSVVLCGGIYTLGDFHLMTYGNAGTGMSSIRLSTYGYFANANLLGFCEQLRYTFGSMAISGVSNNGTSISFNIANCSGSNNATGFWRMISLTGDSANSCINVYVI
jgi:hypothetical protein